MVTAGELQRWSQPRGPAKSRVRRGAVGGRCRFSHPKAGNRAGTPRDIRGIPSNLSCPRRRSKEENRTTTTVTEPGCYNASGNWEADLPVAMFAILGEVQCSPLSGGMWGASGMPVPHQHPGSKEHPPRESCRPPQMPSLVLAHSCLGSAPLAMPQEQAYRRPRGECGEWAFQNPAEDALGDWSSCQDCPRHPVLQGTIAPVGLQPTAPHPPFRV